MTHHPIKHADGKTDRRYAVASEYCGYAEPRFVARFCGDFLGQSQSLTHAKLFCVWHDMERTGLMEAQP